MMTLGDILQPANILLDLTATSSAEVIDEVAAPLQHDARVLDWAALRAALQEAAPCLANEGSDFAICLPHARTDAVTDMVIGVGRARDGLAFPGTPQPVRYIFCIAVPRAMAADYLRLVGMLMRLLRDHAVESLMRQSETPEAFLAALVRLEAKL